MPYKIVKKSKLKKAVVCWLGLRAKLILIEFHFKLLSEFTY